MRTIKASEVRKGMRVRVEEFLGSRTTQVTEGPVLCVDLGYSDEVGLTLDGTTFGLDPDHPVTVLAEPEPEWVEGAWYWTLTASQTTPRIRKRMERGWGSVGVDGTNTAWLDNCAADITVLGRVLIVDWPGDDVAEVIEADNPPRTEPTDMTADDYAAQIIADAIRTQGGAP